MLTVLLGLAGAVSYGIADFLGGVSSRRLRPLTVSAVAGAAGVLPLVAGLAVVGGRLSSGSVAWGLVASLAGSVGVVLLYRALATGPMSILSPVTAVFSAIVPVVVALVGGTALSPLAVAALVVAILAVVLVAAVRERDAARLTVAALAAAVVAGCGFGTLVLAYDASPRGSELVTLTIARTSQAVVLSALALLTRGRAVEAGPRGSRPGGRTTPSGAAEGVLVTTRAGRMLLVALLGCGVFDAGANILIVAALRSGDAGTLPVVSVLNALYPMGTILLAAIVLRERVTRPQAIGIALALAASATLALTG